MVAIDAFLPPNLQQHSLIIEYALACVASYVFFRTFSSVLIPGYSKMKHSIKLDWWNRGTAMIHAAIMFSLAAKYVSHPAPLLLLPCFTRFIR